jgi:hypothetical protein
VHEKQTFVTMETLIMKISNTVEDDLDFEWTKNQDSALHLMSEFFMQHYTVLILLYEVIIYHTKNWK